MTGIVKCRADQLAANSRARIVSHFGDSGPFRTIAKLQRLFSYGQAQLSVTFTDGSHLYTALDREWEVKQ